MLECLRSLKFSEWNAREILVEPFDKSGQWLFTNEDYTNWTASPLPGILWIEGKPGSGKSTLVRKLIQLLELQKSASVPPSEEQKLETHSEPDSYNIVARFFYSFRGGPTEVGHSWMLQSLVYQIWSANARLFYLIQQEFRLARAAANGNHERIKWTDPVLMDVLRSLHRVDFALNVTIVLDGWDEPERADNRRGGILALLRDLVIKPPGGLCDIKILLASRPQLELPRWFQQVQRQYYIRLEDMNAGDIAKFVGVRVKEFEQSLSNLQPIPGYDISRSSTSRSRIVTEEHNKRVLTLTSIEEYINSHAEGVFIWVALVLKDISEVVDKGCVSLGGLLTRVKRLPRELQGKDGFYRRMIGRLEEDMGNGGSDDWKGRMMLTWAAFAFRSLTLDELGDALVDCTTFTASESQSAEFSIADHRIQGLQRGLISHAGGLLEVMIHHTIHLAFD